MHDRYDLAGPALLEQPAVRPLDISRPWLDMTAFVGQVNSGYETPDGCFIYVYRRPRSRNDWRVTILVHLADGAIQFLICEALVAGITMAQALDLGERIARAACDHHEIPID